MHLVRNVILGTCVVATAVAPASAGQLAATKPSNLVAARYAGTGGCCGSPNVYYLNSRVSADASTTALEIADGEAFVVRELHAIYTATPDFNHRVDITLCGGISGVTVDSSFVRHDAAGFANVSFRFGDGIVVRTGQSLCIGPNAPYDAVAYGFLTKEK